MLQQRKDIKSNTNQQSAISLDKIAQLVTNQSKLDKRAKKKALTNAVNIPLMRYAEAIQDNKVKYYRAYTCGQKLTQLGNKISYQRLCNNRSCTTCSAIRTAKLIKKYEKPIKEMQNPMFITLTRQSVYADELEPTIEEMNKAFKRLVRNLQKTYGIKLIAMRKLESQYKYVGDAEYTYNPHFHIVADMLPCQALLLKSLWLNQWSCEIADPDAQQIKKADEGTLLELFKYNVKPITTNKKGKFSPEALHVIYSSLFRKRCIQGYGIRAEKITKEEEEEAETLQASDFKLEEYSFNGLNYSTANGDMLTNFQPTAKDWRFFAITNYDPKLITIYNEEQDSIYRQHKHNKTHRDVIQMYVEGKGENITILQT